MKLTVIYRQWFHYDLPDSGSRGIKAEKDQLRRTLFHQKPVIHGNFCPLKQKIKFRACPNTKRDPRGIFAGGRNDRNRKDIWYIRPKFQRKSRDAFSHTQLHCLCVFLVFYLIVVVMPLIRLVPCSDHCDPVCSRAVTIDKKRKGKGPDMPSHAGSHSDAHHQRKPQRVRHVIQIFKSKHEICLLITHGIPRNEVVISEILLCLLQLYHHNTCLGRGSQKLLSGICRTCRETCRICTMSGLIHSRNSLQRIFRP